MRPPILVVDDNPNNLRSMAALLEGVDAEIVLAPSGTEALRELLRRDFAVVLMDVQMPELDGYQTAQIIRSRDRTRITPIIFVTAFHRSEQNVLKGYELGAVDFLFKPVVPEILTSKVSVFLELYQKRLDTQRQAELLRTAAEREHQRALQDQKLQFERNRLVEEAERERNLKEILATKNEELSRLAEERAHLVAELSERDRRKDEFLAMLAHELRNPLAPIANALELFRRRWGQDADPVLQRALDAADRQARHMTRLVDDLLDVSRITRGKVELRKERTRLSYIVEQAIHASEMLIRQRQHRLELDLPDQELELFADPSRITQVLGNLIQNAAKYTDPGGSLTVRARADGSEAVVEVKDTGIGIRPEMLGSVFDIFVQEEPTSDRAQGGLGLGLTLVKTLVEMHGGAVSAHSEGRGLGSTFRVRLPLAAREKPQLPAEAIVHSLRTNGTRALEQAGPLQIVLVEDNPDIRTTTRDLLELLGHQVEEAGDGEAGVELVLQRQPNIVLVDIGLPGADGYTVASRIRQNAPQMATRLVALTGYGSAEDKNRALAAGFDAHLVKPVTVDQLNQLFSQFFSSTHNAAPQPS